MSYSNKNNLEEIIGKRVLFIDLETTGIVKNHWEVKHEDKYPDYKKLKIYDKARIVSIGWLCVKEYDYFYQITLDDINEKIIKPEGFQIPIESINIHGISNEEANIKGTKIKKILKKVGKKIKKCDYIIGYNIYYDINVLLSELYRKKRKKIIKKILKMKEEKKIICLGEISSKEAQPDGWIKYNNYQMPKQTEVYKKCFNKELPNAHNAKSDVLAMIQIMEWIYENKIKNTYIK